MVGVIILFILMFCAYLSVEIVSLSYKKHGVLASVVSALFCAGWMALYITVWLKSSAHFSAVKNANTVQQLAGATMQSAHILVIQIAIAGVLMVGYSILKSAQSDDLQKVNDSNH